MIASLQNYKTTLTGIAAIATIVAKIATTGHIDLTTDIAALVAGVGLIVAHDPK
jgi:hypothetical protein